MFASARRLLPIALLLAATSAGARADERLKGVACRSVHLAYAGPESVAFYNEVAVDDSASGTYFAVCGWNKGYFGLQELGNGKKLLIFSVWDSKQNDPKAVAEEQRTKLIYKDEKVRVGRFGGEGTGGQSFFDYDWKAGKTYRFLVTARRDESRTEYAGHFYVPEDKAWKHLVTFSTITSGKGLSGCYSFVEDFKRDKVSATHARRAHFGNGWLRNADGEWAAIREARFTADANPALNIDAGVHGGRFFLATGGATENGGIRLNAKAQLPAPKKATPPPDLPADKLTR
ncbi:hypothetical protein AYO40_01630 [Planctomycetaceae bacterium SCGC AG-212-D15]|nr:hypothetical protein AYO40_01630 [Planctomycetaceae bacterium SCGC AG-212-D15]